MTAAEDFNLLPPLPSGRRQRLRTARLTRCIQRLDSSTILLFVSMVVALSYRHELMAGEVVDSLDRDGDLQLVGGGASVSFEHQEIHPPWFLLKRIDDNDDVCDDDTGECYWTEPTAEFLPLPIVIPRSQTKRNQRNTYSR